MHVVKKFQMFAALASCARNTGNFALGEKLFEYAKQLSKIFTELDELEMPFTVAMGFVLL